MPGQPLGIEPKASGLADGALTTELWLPGSYPAPSPSAGMLVQMLCIASYHTA